MTMQTPEFIDRARWTDRGFLGGWRSLAGGTGEVVNPATGATLATVGMAGAQDVALAAREARAAQKDWAARLPQQRAEIINRAADLLEKHGAELSGWIMRDSGSVQAKAMIEIEHGALFLRHAASLATQPLGTFIIGMDERRQYARRLPHGVVGVISPFNFPLVLSLRSIAPALALGNTVVHKPDPRTAISGGIIIARIFEEAGLPPGVLHVLPGGAEAGEALCTDGNVAMISFTGSSRGGAKVGELCGRHLKKVQLELGGKNPLVILDDADLDVAASNAAWGAFLHQGQICMATGLVLTHEKIAMQLAERLAEKARNLPAGDPDTLQVALGPIISDGQVTAIREVVEDAVAKGAKLLAGGRHQGRFFEATVLAGVKPGMRAFDEEIFGPVACVVSFSTDDEAVELANRSEYGLAGGVISADLGRAMALGERLNVGQLHINDQTVQGGPYAPFGGRGKSGNGSRMGGPADIEEFTQWQWVSVKQAATAYPF
ncbi:benzaldehyde dehydrogenase [Allorhizobium undicola]|uniref:benzaldehyde dehydrogenase n=1 Tax=Allorhizobium undicola TaxID=78527 RepID=UPI003D327D99